MQYASDTYEQIIEDLLLQIRHNGGFRLTNQSIDWDEFYRLSEIIHAHFEIPSTTISPFMTRFLFAISHSLCPNKIIGAGTYVGYAFSWLVGRKQEFFANPINHAVAFDTDKDACEIAIRNLSILGHREKLEIIPQDAVDGIVDNPGIIDLLYIDIDDPFIRKRGYVNVLSAALGKISSGGLVLAHDPCIEVFKEDFDLYHEFINKSNDFVACWVFPVDNCGISIAIKK